MSAKFTFKAIGTAWVIDVPADLLNEKEVLDSIQNHISVFDKAYSRFRSDSIVSKMAEKSGVYKLPQDALPMISLYKEMYDLTDGLMTPLVGSVLVDAGYDSEYSLRPKERIEKALEWSETIEYNFPEIEIKKPAVLDFGAMGKGYLIDLVGEVLESFKIFEYMINAGGDIRYRNLETKKLRVGLENPENENEVLGVVEISNKSICGSAGNRRAWGKYHHIINPKTTESPRHILGLWVVAESTILADALATALFFVSPEKLQEKYKFEYVIISADHSVYASENFPGSFFT